MTNDQLVVLRHWSLIGDWDVVIGHSLVFIVIG